MSRSTDQVALVAGVAFVLLALSGLANSTGVLRHSILWPAAVVSVGVAGAVALRTLRAALVPAPVSSAPAADERDLAG